MAIQNNFRFLDDFLSTSNILQEPSVISLTSIADQYVTNFHWFGGNASIFATVNKIKPKIKSLSSKTVTINFMTRSRKFSKGKGGVRQSRKTVEVVVVEMTFYQNDYLSFLSQFAAFTKIKVVQKMTLAQES